MDVIIIGLLLGGTYALMAMGLQLQYGVARIMNLASGETLVSGAFGAVWFLTAFKLSPLYALIGVVPAAFIANWAIYRFMIRHWCGAPRTRDSLRSIRSSLPSD